MTEVSLLAVRHKEGIALAIEISHARHEVSKAKEEGDELKEVALGRGVGVIRREAILGAIIPTIN